MTSNLWNDVQSAESLRASLIKRAADNERKRQALNDKRKGETDHQFAMRIAYSEQQAFLRSYEGPMNLDSVSIN